ncbi:hypothetical protein ABEB36_004050 [Hypothenemus hampei]|uniref:G-protein coupled receptors family 3 profile domain-containing protein n=1 Tax=Hypothenemus hampei TaxID=57062 RepID=A0ABD1F218_HYPHA
MFGSLFPVAFYDSFKNKIEFSCYFCEKPHWKNDQIPLAQRILRRRLVAIPRSLFLMTAGISALGISCSVVFFYFNLKFRSIKTIKLSSPNLNNITVIGCILVYLSVIFFGSNSFNVKFNVYFNQLCLMELCRCNNTIGWHMALFGYKSIILVMGVYMAWKTRHVKVAALNDSQYIGICVYSAVFSTVIVIVFSFVTDYFVLSYIAKTGSILASASITLSLMFLPKLKSIFGKTDSGLSIMESLGLKIECNTRRFIFEDPKESLSRLEIQNKVFKCELESLDKEIVRLEALLNNSKTISVLNLNTIQTFSAEIHYLDVPRASWPIWGEQSLNIFSSDNKLSQSAEEKANFLGKLKRFFGSLTSLNYSQSKSFNKIGETKPRSTPEICHESLEISELNDCIRNSY